MTLPKSEKLRRGLAKRLRESRESLNLSQAAFGAKVGLAQAQISKYETGREQPGSENLRDLAEGLGVSADYLLGLSS